MWPFSPTLVFQATQKVTFNSKLALRQHLKVSRGSELSYSRTKDNTEPRNS